ncbi:MAG: hypothetical protein HY397_02595 [Candidatus Doudnabacteria bacterium]|nr:hypothetical protein [Candidatus Doudnabacteria bacterium]
MANPEMRAHEGADSIRPPARESKEKKNKFKITFPDGTIGTFPTYDDAIEAMRAWREH